MPGSGHRADVSPVPIPASGSSLPPVVPTIDAGKLTAGKAVIGLARAGAFPAAVPVVPTIDAGQFQGQADGGQGGHRPGKRRGLPAAVPVVPTIDGGQPGKPVIVPRSRGADDRRRPVPRASRSSCRGPVVPTIDAGKLTAGQAGHRPGKCRGLSRGRARGADDRRRPQACRVRGQGGHRPGKCRGLPAAVPVVPTIDGGKLTAGKLVIDLASAGPPRGRARADDRRRASCAASWSSCRPWCR